MMQKFFTLKTSYRFKRFSNKSFSVFNSIQKPVTIGVLVVGMLTFAHTCKITAQTSIEQKINEENLPEKELNEVVVTASQVALPLNQAAKLVTVVDKDEIEQSPVQSIQDLLNNVASIDIQQRGGHGVQADVSIRGGSFDQTAILLNGVNLSNPQTGHYSFDIPINLSDIDHIEILHGPSSIIYGASAFSGGINIITKKKPEHTAYSKIQLGSHQLINLEAGGNFQTHTTTNQLSVGYSSSNGYIINSDYDIINALWQTRIELNKSIVDIQLGYNNKQFGANTFYSAEYPNQYDKTSSYLTSIKGEFGDKFKVIPLLYWNRHQDCFELFRDGTANIPSWYKGPNYHQTNVYGANLNVQYRSNVGITNFGAEFRNESILSNVLGKAMNTPKGKYLKSDNRTNMSYSIEHNLLLEKFTLSLSILANHNTALHEGFKFYPSLNTSYRFADNWKVYGSWSKATRMPTFTDLYYTQETHIGNSNLKPETSESFEFGLKYSNHFIKAYLTGYLTDAKNLIDWVKDSPDDKWRSANLTQIYKKGIESGASIYLEELFPTMKNTVLHLGYTHLYQKKNSDELISNYVLNYLRDKLTLQLRHPIYKGITANWNFRWQKRMGTYLKYELTKPTTEEKYPVFSTLDFKISWKLNDFNISIDANNIFDKRYFDIGNIPQAGFWLMTGVSYTFP